MDAEEPTELPEQIGRNNLIRNAGGGDVGGGGGHAGTSGSSAEDSSTQRASMDEDDNFASLPQSEASEEMHDAESLPENVGEQMEDISEGNQSSSSATTITAQLPGGAEAVASGSEERRVSVTEHEHSEEMLNAESLSDNATEQRVSTPQERSIAAQRPPRRRLEMDPRHPERIVLPQGRDRLHDLQMNLGAGGHDIVSPPRPGAEIEEQFDINPGDEQFDAMDLRISDFEMESDPSRIVFDDEQPLRNGQWNIPAGRLYAAISELITEGRRGDGEASNQIGNLLNPETHMQYMRRLLYRVGMNNFRENRRRGGNNASSSGEVGESAEREEDDDENIEEEEPENPIRFDTNLAAEHSYLGSNMSRVSGVNYLEEGQHYNLMLFMHQHVLYPGELLPFMISDALIESDIDDQNGLLFGVCFPFMTDQSTEAKNLYGVTCQIYEKGTDERGNTLIKSRALQRFIVKTTALSGPAPFITVQPQAKCYGLVKILPEIYLPEPLQCINMGSMHRFRDNASMEQQYKRYQAATTPWPSCMFANYSTTRFVDMARTQLAQHKIDTMPNDPVHLSFWLVRNLHLGENITRTIFTMDSVNQRMKLIAKTFKEDGLFACRFCGNTIANCSELFPMSKHGVQTQYCNSAGYIHEINTVYHLLRHAVRHSGRASTEFSWFPGYQWHIIVCKICSRHIGWEFKALEPNLVPKTFYGISRSTVHIGSTQLTDTPAVIYRNFMELARQDIQ